MSIVSAINDITETQGGTPDTSGSIIGAIDALNDTMAGSGQNKAKTIEGAITLLGEHIGGGGETATKKIKTYFVTGADEYEELTEKFAVIGTVVPNSEDPTWPKNYEPVLDPLEYIDEAPVGSVIFLDSQSIGDYCRERVGSQGVEAFVDFCYGEMPEDPSTDVSSFIMPPFSFSWQSDGIAVLDKDIIITIAAQEIM